MLVSELNLPIQRPSALCAWLRSLAFVGVEVVSVGALAAAMDAHACIGFAGPNNASASAALGAADAASWEGFGHET